MIWLFLRMRQLVCSTASRPSIRPYVPRLSNSPCKGNSYCHEHSHYLQTDFLQIDALVCRNLASVQHAFDRARIGSETLQRSGVNQPRRSWNALDNALADIMGTESAFWRSNILSGAVLVTSFTHIGVLSFTLATLLYMHRYKITEFMP